MRTLNDPSLLETRAYVNGVWVDGEKTFDVENPATGEVIARVPDLNAEDVRRAIDAAHDAKRGWAQADVKTRSATLRKLFDLMVENADDLATILTSEMGKPWAEARGEILYGASYVEWFAEEAKRVYGDMIPGPQNDKRMVIVKQPVGVVGAITPWNFPNAMLARKMAPALSVGCAMVARPSEFTPLSALALAKLAERAGVPAGVFNVLTGLDASGMGMELCANPKVAKITFTGSTRVGKILLKQGAGTVKKMSMELGGNAPFIVFDDADIDAAVEGAMIAKFRNNGQTCVCANRIYVQAGVYDAFAEKLAKALETLTLGDGFDDGVNTGPLINAAAVAKVEDHIADAISKGAKVVTGGNRSNLGQTFFEPTLLRGVTQAMKVATEETFGPLAPLVKFETEEEALSYANATEFGLASYFYTNDLKRAWRMGEALETGMVGINTGAISTEMAPFGGVKQSGMGREGSKYGCDDYLEIKNLCFGGLG
ncbi:NAD-dependent succinate-semialdehyde dehydrogenase [Celeribacter halophilus]|uniref:NAD-dependent succinate-semialdehyde dehydrogenase n=1 Tax=Celeribacter halophilus TaxID=576117 RepID=UPI001C0A19A2|nr:NAD-dependent succinate-semialdehyde dehydrogenase [Celeribacter halophilus]MBU2888402.1 NAD-dependent succinate-semialdehyde dehydrogenase [Celeribacter halophilus]MDO6509244.1 NAD-dependent succinate-semialdehyde dehydrogenase [Celeribacter halophilus]